MIDSRKLTVHTYDEETANNVVEKIAETYFDLFAELQEKLDKEE